MSGIFINFRTGDGHYAAGLIDERLRAEFGDDNVFRDARSMRPGTDFPPELRRRLEESTVLLAVIGPDWLTIADDAGTRRLDVSSDYVRSELAIALRLRIPVIPVLLDGVSLPAAAELPDDIASLNTRQYLRLRVRDLPQDLDRLVAELAVFVPLSKGRPDAASARDSGAGQQSGVNIQGTQVVIQGGSTIIGGNVTGV